MPDEPQETPEAESPPAEKTRAGRRRWLPLAASAVVLLAGGATAAWYLGLLPLGEGLEAAHGQATAAVPDDHGGAGAHRPGLGPMLAFDPFIANLADEGGKRYLKATFQVEFFGAAVPPEANARLPQVRDLVLTLLTSKSFDEVRTPVGKQQLREEIIDRLNQVIERDAVKAVYFTEFIVQ
jgi:flagellar FliL protein